VQRDAGEGLAELFEPVRDLLHRDPSPTAVVFLDEGEKEFIGEFACVTP
jgi:hypothetical protein